MNKQELKFQILLQQLTNLSNEFSMQPDEHCQKMGEMLDWVATQGTSVKQLDGMIETLVEHDQSKLIF